MDGSSRPTDTVGKRAPRTPRTQQARSSREDPVWLAAWEEFFAEFARHCDDHSELNEKVRKKLRDAFEASVGKALEGGKKWRKNGSYTVYADFVVNHCACDLGYQVKKLGKADKVTVGKLKSVAMDLARNKWQLDCSDPAASEAVEPDTTLEVLGPSCTELIKFLEDPSKRIAGGTG